MTTENRIDSPRSAAYQISSRRCSLEKLAPRAALSETHSLEALYASSVTAKIWNVASKRLRDVRIRRSHTTCANVVPVTSAK